MPHLGDLLASFLTLNSSNSSSQPKCEYHHAEPVFTCMHPHSSWSRVTPDYPVDRREFIRSSLYFLLQFLIILSDLLKLQVCEPSQNGLNEWQLEEQRNTEEEHDVGLSSSGRPMGLEAGSLGEQHRCPPGFP